MLARPRLLSVVEGRWSRAVTAIVAGAGFGKTTLLDQAMAENRRTLAGRDVPLRIDPGDASAVRLASRILEALGVEGARLAPAPELLDQLVDELWTRAPAPLCLVLDDLHELPPDSDGTRLLRDLTRRLPGNTHLLVGSRTLPEIGIARLAVNGAAVVLREADLRFTEKEVRAFASARGVDPERVGAADGWPALAELLVRSPGVSATEYVWEEVIGPIALHDRDRVVELAAVTRADDALISAIAGTSVRLASLLADVPLARRGPDGAWELHDVIASALLEREDPDRVAEIRRVAGEHLRAVGDLDGAIRLLGAADDRDATIAVLRDQFVQMGSQEEPSLAARWVALLDPSVLDEPEALLAQSVAAMLVDPERAFTLGASAVDEFRARDDVDGETAAFSMLGGIAYALVDAARMVPYVARIAELAETGNRSARALDAMCVGAFALLVGDWERAHEVLLPVVTDPAGDVTQGNAGFLCARAMLEGGRLQDAAVLIGRMPAADRARVRDGILGVEVAIAQGLGADTEVMEELRAVAESRVDRRPAVARRVARCRLAEGLAIAGDVPGARRHLAELDLLGPTMDATRDDELFSSAVVAVAAGDEPTAAELLAQIPDRGAFFPPFHGLALFYVLRPELRARYADRRPEGVHAQRCAFAAAFVAARAGDTEALARYPWPRADVVRWFAPAAWLVEAMVRTSAAGGTPPADLWATLAPTQRAVLRRLAGDAEPSVARVAARGDEALGPAAPGRLVIRVLGELELEFDGVVVGGPELRRERVRALLALLVLRRSVRRSEAAATLWPDLDDDAALGNLRVTLTHLLKLLEPHRDRNAPSYFVRQDRDRLGLPTDPALEVDVWEFESAIERAARAEQMTAPVAVVDALGPAVERWRGDPFADLGSYEWLDFERLRLRTQYVRAALRLGELCVADHDADRAELMARRAIAADPWCEAAYRLLASAHTERGDSSGARQVLGHLNDLLAELELTPEPATAALLEQFHLAR